MKLTYTDTIRMVMDVSTWGMSDDDKNDPNELQSEFRFVDAFNGKKNELFVPLTLKDVDVKLIAEFYSLEFCPGCGEPGLVGRVFEYDDAQFVTFECDELAKDPLHHLWGDISLRNGWPDGLPSKCDSDFKLINPVFDFDLSVITDSDNRMPRVWFGEMADEGTLPNPDESIYSGPIIPTVKIND